MSGKYRMLPKEKDPIQAVLNCPMDGANGAEAASVGEYLSSLLSTLWMEDEGFSGKRPFGDSGWQYEVYLALGIAGLIEIQMDEDGYVSRFEKDEEYRADEMILQAIKEMGKT